MRASGWFLVIAGTVVAVEFLMVPVFGNRSVGALVTEKVACIASLQETEVSIGAAVADLDASRIRGAATMEPECSGWDVDSDGCENAYFNNHCPDNFDAFDTDDCWFCDYTNHKSTGTRECSGGNAEYTREGSCYECVVTSLGGCVVKG